MSLSLYDVSAPVFRQYLAALSGILTKAEAHCASGALTEADVIGFRLFEDMQPLWFQVRQSIVHSAGAVATLRGRSYPRAEKLETLNECKMAVDAAVAYLDAVKPSDLSLDARADVALNTPRGATITALNFLLALSYGHFFFHVTTAYDILRHQGVAIGKRDFTGEVLVRVGDQLIDAWEGEP